MPNLNVWIPEGIESATLEKRLGEQALPLPDYIRLLIYRDFAKAYPDTNSIFSGLVAKIEAEYKL